LPTITEAPDGDTDPPPPAASPSLILRVSEHEGELEEIS
jgi:hypothetical protein